MGSQESKHGHSPYVGDPKSSDFDPSSYKEARLLGAIRAQIGAEGFDVYAEKEKMGIFDNPNKHSKDVLTRFFPHLLDAILTIERGLFGKNLNSQAEKDTQATFSALTTMLARVLYWSDKTSKEEWTEMLQRYRITSKTNVYCPDIPAQHREELRIDEEFKVGTAMQTVVSVYDTKTRQSLEFRLFPLDYSYYHKVPGLAGAPPDEGRTAIETKKVGHTGLQTTHVALETAQKSYVPAHLEIGLLNERGCEISQMRIEQRKGNGIVAFTPQYHDLEIPYKVGNGKQVQFGETFFTRLVKPLATMQLKTK